MFATHYNIVAVGILILTNGCRGYAKRLHIGGATVSLVMCQDLLALLRLQLLLGMLFGCTLRAERLLLLAIICCSFRSVWCSLLRPLLLLEGVVLLLWRCAEYI